MLLEIEQREVDEFYIVCGDMELQGPFESRKETQERLTALIEELRREI